MTDDEIKRLAEGSPLLMLGGVLPIAQVSSLSGLPEFALLRMASDGKLRLFAEAGNVQGYLVNPDSLELQDPEAGIAGGYVVPDAQRMPRTAVRTQHQGRVMVDQLDLPGVCMAIEQDQPVTLVCMRLESAPSDLFIPDEPCKLSSKQFALATAEVEHVRRRAAATIDPDRLKTARAAVASPPTPPSKAHPHAGKRFLDGLAEYAKVWLPVKVHSADERKRIQKGITLFSDLMGNPVLADIQPSDLRLFRDSELRKVPADENKVRLMHKTNTVTESIAAISGTSWPTLSPKARDLRMQWIASMFKWLKRQGWIDVDPMAALEGESVRTLAEKKRERTAEDRREPFSAEDLNTLFKAIWFETGRGVLTRQNTYREFLPYYYWLPLIGIYQGARINEICQLYLDDIFQDEDGTWGIDINENREGQRLKNKASKRCIPVHPELLRLGFEDWVTALRSAGYQRLFPELLYDEGKGYSKAAVKWFSGYKKRLGLGNDGVNAFHSFRHTFINQLPTATDEATARLRRQLVGHERGEDIHSKVYMHDVTPSQAVGYLSSLNVKLPAICPFDVAEGLKALKDALSRKNRGKGVEGT